MVGERQPYLPGLRPEGLLFHSENRTETRTCSVGTVFLTPKAIDTIVALSLPVARQCLAEFELGYGEGEAVKRIIKKIIDAFPKGGRPIVDLVGLDREIEIFRYAVKRAESISRIEFLGGDACSLPFPDKARDFILAAGLLTQNIEDDKVRAILKEAVRVAEVVAICDFEMLDSKKTHQQKIINPERLRVYQRRYEVTAEALGVPFGTIISTILPDSNPILERKLRELELRRDAEGLNRICHQNQEELRLSRHFELADLENWLSSSGAQIVYSEIGIPYSSPSGNPLSGLILVSYSLREL